MSRVILLCALAAFLEFALCAPNTLIPNASKDRTAALSNAITQEIDTAGHTTTPSPVKNAVTQAREKLSAMIHEGTQKHLNFLLQSTNRIAKGLLADPAIINTDTELMRNERSVLAQYVKDSEDALQPAYDKCKKRVLKQFFTFSNRYTKQNVNLTAEENIIWNSLQSHGYEQFEIEENKLLSDIGNHYADEFEHYLNSLTQADKEKEKNLIYVYETYMENKAIMDRVSYGYRFRDFFQNDGENELN